MPESKTSSLKSVTLAVQHHKNEVLDKKAADMKNLMTLKKKRN